MSNYSDAHGHTATVDLTVSNHEPLYRAFMSITDRVQPDAYGSVTDSLETAAAEYRRMVRTRALYFPAKYPDLIDVDIDRVDWFGLIRDELAERAIFARNFPPCDECGEGIPATARSHANRHHSLSCSLYEPEAGRETFGNAGCSCGEADYGAPGHDGHGEA